jgi:hypothetical protein
LSWTTSGGAKIKWELPERNDLDAFDKAKVRKKRKGAAERYYLTVHDVDGTGVWRTDEVLFLGSHWSDTAGPIVVFELDSPETLLEYRALRVTEENSTGDTRLLTVFQVGDDDVLVNQELAARDDPPPLKGGPKSRHAGRLCREPDFQEFVRAVTKRHTLNEDYKTEETHAAVFVRQKCGIESRAELDHNPEALEKYKILVEGPYIRYWTQRQHGHQH